MLVKKTSSEQRIACVNLVVNMPVDGIDEVYEFLTNAEEFYRVREAVIEKLAELERSQPIIPSRLLPFIVREDFPFDED